MIEKNNTSLSKNDEIALIAGVALIWLLYITSEALKEVIHDEDLKQSLKDYKNSKN